MNDEKSNTNNIENQQNSVQENMSKQETQNNIQMQFNAILKQIE